MFMGVDASRPSNQTQCPLANMVFAFNYQGMVFKMVIRVHAKWSEANFLGTVTHFIETPTAHFPEGDTDPENVDEPYEFYLERAKKAIVEDVQWAVENIGVTEGSIRRPPARWFYKDFWIDINPFVGQYDGNDLLRPTAAGVIREHNALVREQKGFTQTFDFEIESRFDVDIIAKVIFLARLTQEE